MSRSRFLKSFFLCFGVLLLAGCSSPNRTATDIEVGETRKKVAILGFFNIGAGNSMRREFQSWSDYFVSRFSRVPSVELMERELLGKVMQEQKLQLSGITDQRTAISVGQLTGADYILLGSYKKDSANVRVYSKLIHSGSGMVVLSKSTETTVQNLSLARVALADEITGEFKNAIIKFNAKLLRISAQKGSAGVDMIVKANDSAAHGEHNEGINLLKASVAHSPSAEAYYRLGKLYKAVNELDNAVIAFEQAAGLYEAGGKKIKYGHTFIEIGSVLLDQGKYALARKYFNRAMDIANELGDNTIRVWAHGNIGGAYLQENELGKAEEHLVAAKKICARLNIPDTAAAVNANLGKLYRARGDYDKAIAISLASLKTFKSLGDQNNAEIADIDLGEDYNRKGEHDEALKYYLEGILSAEKTSGISRNLGILEWQAGATYLALGRKREAIGCLMRGVKDLEKAEDWNNLARAVWQVIALLWESGSPAEAVSYYEKGIKAIEKIGLKSVLARDAYYLGAKLYLKTGDLAKAIDFLERTIGLDELNNFQDLSADKELLRNTREYGLQGEIAVKKEDFSSLFKPRVAILDIPVSGSGNMAPLLRSYSDKLLVELVKSKDIVLVERKQMNAVMREIKYAQSGLFDANTLARIEKILGANILIMGKSHAENERAEINVRVVDVGSGKVLGGVFETDVRAENLSEKIALNGDKILKVLRFSSIY